MITEQEGGDVISIDIKAPIRALSSISRTFARHHPPG